jgi:hypothetical protein
MKTCENFERKKEEEPRNQETKKISGNPEIFSEYLQGDSNPRPTD